jgi:hypothetical protein
MMIETTSEVSEWETPEFVEIRMDAEIGSYQASDRGQSLAPLSVAPLTFRSSQALTEFALSNCERRTARQGGVVAFVATA